MHIVPGRRGIRTGARLSRETQKECSICCRFSFACFMFVCICCVYPRFMLCFIVQGDPKFMLCFIFQGDPKFMLYFIMQTRNSCHVWWSEPAEVQDAQYEERPLGFYHFLCYNSPSLSLSGILTVRGIRITSDSNQGIHISQTLSFYAMARDTKVLTSSQEGTHRGVLRAAAPASEFPRPNGMHWSTARARAPSGYYYYYY